METTSDDPGRSLRRTVYLLLAVTALASAAGRIMSVRATTGETPMLSANDRSRWCTIAALVDHGSYQIDEVIEQKHERTKRRHWYTIDMVRHRGPDGREHFYSSKPPLLPTLLAGEYWLIRKALGLNITQHPFYVMRLMLVVTNVGLLAVYFWLMGGIVERYGKTDWGRLLCYGVVTWGTFLTTFAVTLNNHLPAAVSVLVAVALGLAIQEERLRSIWAFLGAGLAAGFSVANELPALAFLMLFAIWMFRLSPRKTLLGYLPGVVIVAAAFVGTNYLAHDTWKAPYAHRQDGPVLGELAGETVRNLAEGTISEALRKELAEKNQPVSAASEISKTHGPQRWMLWDKEEQKRLALVVDGNRIQVRSWDNWYEYEKSYWLDPKGIDQGEESRWAYAIHALLGHHGIFSLTPIWLMSLCGVVLCLRRPRGELWVLAVAGLTLTGVCLAFYVGRPLQDRNYGGVSCGFRWLFWLIPLWTALLLPACDQVASSRFGRRLVYLALAVSIFSASYAALNPWSHPWLYSFWSFLGWLPT